MHEHGSRDWAVERIKPFRADLWDAVQLGLQRYQRHDVQDRLDYNARTSANILNSFVLAEVQKRLSGHKKSRFIERNGTVYHELNGCVLWYKGLGADGKPSNHPSGASDDLMQGTFPFKEALVLLLVGYSYDSLLSDVKGVEIRRYNAAGNIEYYIELEKLESNKKLVVMPGTQLPGKTAKRRVRIKMGPEQTHIHTEAN
ncbi:MAG: hypothetical protein JSS87_03980 [Acidobacteria bacterium]|nr:hypothetical protein [Acidobacteriota bacterium]